MRIVSPKHQAMMEDALHRVYEGTFDESDIRALLIGVRGVASYILQKIEQNPDTPDTMRRGWPYLKDISDSVAHPELKDRGPLRDYVKNTDKQMAKALRKMPRHRVFGWCPEKTLWNLSMPPAIKPLPVYPLFLAFSVALRDIFPLFEMEKVVIRAQDIELCLFSILHFTKLPMLDGGDSPSERHGYLGIHTWQGRYHLYAGVYNSNYERVLSQGRIPLADSRRPFINAFPVFNGMTPNNGILEFDVRFPKVVFAVRDEFGCLVLKEWTSRIIAEK